jgi:hypothetical protein
MFDWLVDCECCFSCIGNEVVVVEVVDDVVDVCLCMLLELCLILVPRPQGSGRRRMCK